MKSNFSRFLAGAIATACLCFSVFACAEVVVVVSSKSPVTSLSADQVSQIFLGKNSTYPTGGQAIPIDQNEGSNIRNEFYMKVAGKDFSQVKAYWSKQVFTGKIQPPKEVAGNGDVKKLLADNPSLIGYVDKSAVDGSLKVVLVP